MDVPPAPALKYRRWLPYWAVLQTDLRQTLRGWVYQLWVLLTVLTAAGYLIYRVGISREAGLVQPASLLTSELLGGMVLGSLALIVVLAVSAISAERGTLADSVLSRGISRFQYFLAKWHARLLVVLLTFALTAAAVLVSSYFLLDEDLSLAGSLVAVGLVGALLLAIVSWGVAFGALANSTVMGITLLWVLLYGSGFLLNLLPPPYPSPERTLHLMPQVLRGNYDPMMLGRLLAGSAAASLLAVLVGFAGFARKDV